MESQDMHQQITWTEAALAEEIEGFKTAGDQLGLEQFLRECLEDTDPCCVHLKSRFLNEYGLLSVASKKTEKAADCFKKALAIDTENIKALYNLGTLQMEQGAYTEALGQFKKVMQREPDHFSSLFNSGLCLLYQERQQAALPFFERAAELQPQHGHTRYLAGEILMQLGEAVKALPHFEAAYRDHHDHFETAMGLAIALLQTKSYESAAKICDEALMTFGAATLPLQIKGDAMLALEEFEMAVMCHVDLCNLDLDIRDFVVSRLTKLAEENPDAFAEYTEVVRALFPDFESMVERVLKATRRYSFQTLESLAN
jgi:lipopolysaccharide biosynthesis regulator YciM